jgi:hypothetical protein
MSRRTLVVLPLAGTLLVGAVAGTGDAAAPDPIESITGTAAATAPVHTVAGCEVFPADNPWNTRIDGRPVFANSAKIIAKQTTGHPIHLDLGTTETYYGIPVNKAKVDQPTLPLRFGIEGENYKSESDKGRAPIPTRARIEGWRKSRPNPPSGDRHVITVQRGTCKLIELYKAKRVRNSGGRVVAWRASAAARWDLSSNALRPKYWTSADAAGLPILPGLLDYDEAASGQITHALRFTLPVARNAFTHPARHCGTTRGAAYPAYGLRFRLKKSFSTKPYTGAAKAVVVAMKRYGLMYADQGSSMYVTGSADPRWSGVLDQLRAHPIDGSRFEVVKPTGRITVCK